jgi:hypothetical protein
MRDVVRVKTRKVVQLVGEIVVWRAKRNQQLYRLREVLRPLT